MKNITKKIQIIALMTTMLIALSLPMFATTVSADVLPNWDVTGDWVIQATLGTTFDHDFTLTMSINGEFTGIGGYPAGGPYAIEETVTGTVNGDSITWTSVYYSGNVPYSWDFVGTIAVDGTISGTWGNEAQLYGHKCISISGTAQPPILTLTFPPESTAEVSVEIIPDGELPPCTTPIPGEGATPYISVVIDTGEFEGIVKMCIRYDDEDMTLNQEKKLRLYRFDCIDVDFNDDKTINGEDLSLIKKAIKSGTPSLAIFDVNNDDDVTDADVAIVKEYMANGLIVNKGSGAESQVRLPWLDITVSVDTDANIICAETDHFSIFRCR